MFKPSRSLIVDMTIRNGNDKLVERRPTVRGTAAEPVTFQSMVSRALGFLVV